MKPFFSYYGGKYRAAKLYPRPKYHPIIEPFAGSAGYSVYYEPEVAILLDVNPIICEVWNYLIRVNESEILSLPDLEVGQNVSDLHVCQEIKWLIGFWINAANSSPCNIPSKWMRDYISRDASWVGSQLFWSDRVRQRLANQVGKIRRWIVRNLSYEAIHTHTHTHNHSHIL